MHAAADSTNPERTQQNDAMTTAQLDHLRAIDTHCADLLDIGGASKDAEAGWKATRAAIAEILAAHEAAYEGWCLVAKELNQDPGSFENYPLPPWSQHILAAFPLESLTS